jgi:hypothetical protein
MEYVARLMLLNIHSLRAGFAATPATREPLNDEYKLRRIFEAERKVHAQKTHQPA